MIKVFLAWIRSNEDRLKAAPLFFKMRKSEFEDETITPPMHKAHVGLLSDNLIASFTVWDTGICEIIFMNNLTTEEYVAVDRKFNTPSELLVTLNEYSNLLGSGTSFDDLKLKTQT